MHFTELVRKISDKSLREMTEVICKNVLGQRGANRHRVDSRRGGWADPAADDALLPNATGDMRLDSTSLCEG